MDLYNVDGFGPAHVILGCGHIQRVQLFGGEPDRNDLHRLGSTTGATVSVTLQFFDAVANF